MNRYDLHSRKNKVLGYSLVELMIAILLSTFIIGGFISVFIASIHSYNAQKALTEVQNKGRYALLSLRSDIQLAGFGVDYSAIAVKIGVGTEPSDIDCVSIGTVLELQWIDPKDDKRRRVCFYLEAENDGTFLLKRNYMEDNSTPDPTKASEIIKSVESFNLFFALDSDSVPGINKINNMTYITAATIESESKLSWDQVRAVRIEMIIASDQSNITRGQQVLSDPFARNTNITAHNTNQRLIQPFVGSFALRNRIP